MGGQETQSSTEDAGSTPERTGTSPSDVFPFHLSDSWNHDMSRPPQTPSQSADGSTDAMANLPPASGCPAGWTNPPGYDPDDSWFDVFWDTLSPPRIDGQYNQQAQERHNPRRLQLVRRWNGSRLFRRILGKASPRITSRLQTWIQSSEFRPDRTNRLRTSPLGMSGRLRSR